MISLIKDINAGSLDDLLSNQIFNYYLSNESNDASFSPTQGVINSGSPFTTNCTFNTTGCFNGSVAGSPWADFVPDKDLNATVSLNTNLTLFWCIKPATSDQIQGFIHTQNRTPDTAGLFIYYDTSNNFHIDLDWGDGESISKTLALDSVERQSPYCFTAIINSTGRSVELYFNNTFKANYSATTTTANSMGTNLIIGRQNEFNGRPFSGEFELMSFYNITLNQTLRDFIWNNGNPFVIINNIIPTVTMNFPKNRNTTHNKTIVFNFTIDDPNDDKINYTLWADTNSTPDTNINQTLNVTKGNFTFNYTFGTEINGSINGTYYWKVNGTDNNSNNFRSSIFTFNITNNISAYNVTNVSIIPLPLNQNDEAKCHFNITNKYGQEDIISISDQRWWLNGSLVAEAGNKTLSANNVTLNSNITCEARINNGYGQTAWTEYVNSSKVTVADTVAPILNNCTLSSTSITDASGNTINLTCDATDASSSIQTMVASLNGTINKTLTFSFTQSRNIISSYIIFESLETLSVGTYSINQVNVTDTSSNKLSNTTKDLHFAVTSAPSPSSPSTTPSGGGGGMPFIPSCSAGEVLFSNKCVNSSSFNQTFKITSLQNIDQIVFITSCFSGEKSEFRTAIKTNKLIGSASFEKPQPSFNINIDKSDLIVTRKLDLKNRISQRIDAGSIRIISSVGEVARANLAIRAINICSAIPLSPQKIKGDVGARRLFFDISEVNKINFIKGILIFPLIVIIIFGGMGAYLYKKTSNKTS